MRLNAIYGLAIGALMGGMMVSCSNDLSDPSYVASNGDQVNLVKAPDVIAWSGEQVLGNTFSSTTRANEGENSYNYSFPEEMSKLNNITIPTDAEEFKDDWTWINNHQNASGSFFIPAEETRSYQVPNGFSGSLYVAGTYNPQTLGNNKGISVYVLEGGNLSYETASTDGNDLYNAGKVNITGDLSNVKVRNIYNSGELYITNKYYKASVNVNNGVSIYSTGYIEFEGDQIDIKGKIISNNIVKATGNIKFQNSDPRDICWLQAPNGLVEITDNTNIFGQITAKNLKFDGAKIKLHPEGFIDITNDVTITNSGCAIQPFASGYKGLVKCSTLNVLNTGDQPSSIFPDGIYFNLSSNNLTFSPDNHNGKDWIIDRINTTMTVTPSCGADSEPDDPDPDPEVPETPVTPPTEDGSATPVKHNNEVEVNLAILDQHEFPDFPEGIADLVTKLSIHVRCATDVEIKIPVPNKYVIESDDLVIFNNHLEGNGAYGGTLTELLEENATQTLSYVVADQTVTLTVSFENDNIVVRTSGINQAVIDYCEEKYGDGINFEIYNYYQMVKQVWDKDDEFSHVEATDPTGTDLTKDILFGFLDDSTIEFLDENPEYYINAFGCANTDGLHWGLEEEEDQMEQVNHTCDKHEGHATVRPSASSVYGENPTYEQTTHLNGTPFNDIYVKNDVTADDAHNGGNHHKTE